MIRTMTRSRPRQLLLPYALLAPAAIIFGLILGFPLVRLVLISCQDYGLRTLFTGSVSWAGFGNYTAVLSSSQLGPVLARTVVFCATLVAGTLVIGMLVAHALGSLGRRMRLAVMLCLLPAWAMPQVIAALIWQWLFQPAFGVVNWLLSSLGVFGNLSQHDFLATPVSAFTLVWLLVVWESVPFVALTLHAGLSQIPHEYYEAAALDGAGWWRRFRVITLPFLRPVLLIVIVLSVVWDFNVYNQIWVLTQGGPDSGTTTIGIWSFTQAFSSQNYGQGAAIAVLSVLLLMLLTGYWVRRLVRVGQEGA
jgi:N,N'-diacetylchitobiose transport system permease protein